MDRLVERRVFRVSRGRKELMDYRVLKVVLEHKAYRVYRVCLERGRRELQVFKVLREFKGWMVQLKVRKVFKVILETMARKDILARKEQQELPEFRELQGYREQQGLLYKGLRVLLVSRACKEPEASRGLRGYKDLDI
jgi:hypothetical protein